MSYKLETAAHVCETRPPDAVAVKFSLDAWRFEIKSEPLPITHCPYCGAKLADSLTLSVS